MDYVTREIEYYIKSFIGTASDVVLFNIFKYVVLLVVIIFVLVLIIKLISNSGKNNNNNNINNNSNNQNNNVNYNPNNANQTNIPSNNMNYRQIEGNRYDQNDNKVTMIGKTGLYAGQRLEFFDGILIGRDPTKVNLIFEPNSRGVSSLHCRVYKDRGVIKIIDFSSSYGTFLNGRRIQPQMETQVNSGDEIYLGFQENSFIVI